MKLKANTQTREVTGGTAWHEVTLLHVESKFAVLKVPGMSYWVDSFYPGYQDYQHARMIVCRVTSRKKDTVWLEELFTFSIR